MGSQSYDQSSEKLNTGQMSKEKGGRERGQIVVEYVLLLLVVVTIASLLVREMVQRGPSPEERGFIIQGWAMLVEDIAADQADEP